MTCKYGLDEAIYREDSFRRRSVSLTEMNDSPTQSLVSSLGPKYTVLIISDMHYGKSGHSQHEDELLSWIDSLPASKKPAFCINLGDTADHGLPGELDSFLAFESRLKQRIPNVYNIVGNHDLYNSGWSGWKEKMYPHNSFYHFETSAFSWYFLDSGSGTLGKRQMDEFEKVLRNDSKQKIVSLRDANSKCCAEKWIFPKRNYLIVNRSNSSHTVVNIGNRNSLKQLDKFQIWSFKISYNSASC